MNSPLPMRIQGYQDMKFLCQTKNSYIYVTRRDCAPKDEDIVLKFIPIKDSTQKNKLDSECRIQSSIGHSYIMPINTFFDYTEGSETYRVIEMPLGGDNLLNGFTNNLLCGIKHIFKIIVELSAAVNYLHSHQILHGAICPENVIMKKSSEEYLIPQLSGFQFARLLSIYSPGNTSCNCRNRIQNFAAPELLESRSHSYPSDIWALGATFYFIITGNFIQNPKNLELDFESEFGPQFPESGRDLVRRMLSVDPNMRPTAANILRCEFYSEIKDQGLDQTAVQNSIHDFKFMFK